MNAKPTRTLTDHLTLGDKIGKFLNYVIAGNEQTINGTTYVWCDEHITRTEMDDSGQEQHFGINGLAIKATVTTSDGTFIEHRYMGYDLSINQLVELLDELTEEDWLGITAFHALRSVQKKRK